MDPSLLFVSDWLLSSGAAELGVSRGPVREALGRLVQEELLVKERGRRLRVPVLDIEEIKDIYRTRTTLEVSALLAIINKENSDFIAKARQSLESLAEAINSNDPHLATEADLAFHQLIIDRSGSSRLARAFATLSVETQMCLSALNEIDPHQSESIELHTDILDAVEEGDFEKVIEAVQRHNDAMITLFEEDIHGKGI